MSFAHKAVGGAQLCAGFVETPKLIKVLFRAPPDLLLIRFLQAAGSDGELTAKLIQKCPRNTKPVGWCKGSRRRMELPAGVVRAQRLKPAIANPQQADVFQVRLHDPPTAPQVFVDAILGQFDKHPHYVVGGGRRRIKLRILGDTAYCETAGGDNCLCDAVESQFVMTQQGRVQRATKQRDVNKIVEVPGLERSVLPIIGEREDLVSRAFHAGRTAEQ